MDKATDKGFWQFSLGRKLTLRIVLFSSLVTLLLTLVQLGFEFRQLSKKLDQMPHLVEKTLLPAMADAIWSFDRKQLQTLLQGVNQLEYIEYSQLKLEDGTLIEYSSAESRYVRYFELPVKHKQGQELAVLQLRLSVDQALQQLLQQASIILLKNGLKTLVVVLFILIVMRNLVGKHLLEMMRYLQNFHVGRRQSQPLALNRSSEEQRDELDQLADSFNQLNQRLEQEHQARTAAEDKRREAEQKLLHLERIGTMGELATSLAHELNQPLSAIMGYSDVAARLSRAQETGGEQLGHCVNKIGDEAERAADIIKRTRAFVKREVAQAERLDLSEVTQESIALIQHRTLQRGVDIDFTPCPGQYWVEADKIQLQQVLVNLLNNAIEAQISTANARVELSISQHQGQLLLRVLDKGPGIGDEVKKHLFEPFVTSKSEGMGLGLVICRNIVEAAQGQISAENREEGGAVFSLRFPSASVE